MSLEYLTIYRNRKLTLRIDGKDQMEKVFLDIPLSIYILSLVILENEILLELILIFLNLSKSVEIL